MASPLKDIKTNFCECAICLSDLKQPKQLTECLHRFCRDCLVGLIGATEFGSFKCPLCKREYPTNGGDVDQFATDLLTDRTVQFIRDREEEDPEYEAKLAAPFSEQLREITKQFLQCSVCLEPFKDPKQLPVCLHRICRECLSLRIIGGVNSFNCPECWHEYATPKRGEDHFKSDFHIEGVVAIIKRRYLSERSFDLSLPVFVKNGVIRGPPLAVVDIRGIKGKGWEIQNMTSSRNGRIFVTGTASKDSSHITITDMKGEIGLLHQVQGSIEGPVRYCDSLSRNKVVTVCMDNQFVIYNIRRGGCVRKDVSNVTRSNRWPDHQYICCLAVNPANKNIFVGSLNIGGDSRDVLVFDGELNYLHSLKLPKMTRELRDITIHTGNLVVCDSKAGEAYAVATNALDAKLVYKLIKPGCEDSFPFRACVDSCGHIYMLWTVADGNGRYTTVLTQYSKNGRQLLTAERVDDDAFALCTTLTQEGERLLVATRRAGKLYIYRLIT